MQLSLTQLLLTTVMLRQGLTSLRLRMGTNSTPKPFFRPPLNLHTIINLRVMHLIDVDDVSVLKSLGLALQASAQLEQLSIWADHQSQLSVDTLFKQWHEPAPFRLRSLDIRGFFDIGTSAKRFWAAIPPTKLRELTLQLGPHFLMQDSADFWDASIQAELRPAQLASNLGATGLQDFLMSFSGLEAFQLLPSDMPRPMEPMRALMNALESHHFASLRVLGLSPFRCEARYMLDVSNLTFLVGALPNIEEFRFSLPGFNAELIETALLLPRLRVVQIDPVHDDSRMQSRFSKFILHLLHKGVARNLTYIAFDDADVREIFRDPIHMSNKISLVGYVDGTVLLKEKALDWVRPYF
ncbi:hypothetical protein BDV28DRAFT_75088 [Aspergillus coremiiformis]|uniref:F-box domain-containing protein n=1 Tax=Aspergillus coremiiformis TaxID=138285 RepID=A0A5N6YW41_9EURO|nr:hypothetical protein BDV28DRAFT_75088 [Aspergillus coremiiformis]